MSWVKTYGRCLCTQNIRQLPYPANDIGCPSMFKKILTDLLALTTVTKESVGRYFPGVSLFAPFSSAMDATISVSPALFTRIAWAQRNKPNKYDKTSAAHIYQLKDIYAEFGYDWTTDPILNPVTN